MPPSDSGKPQRSLPLHALAAAVVILIAYGSLYPFAFQPAGSLSADISHFLASAGQAPAARGDILANLLLYMPLGLAATLALGQSMPRILAALLTFAGGCLLSLSVELAQFYDASRVSAFSDFYLNGAGLFVGILVALAAGARLVKTSWPAGSAPAFARLLLLAWLAWRLYPYVPTLQIHKYWSSLQPVLFAPAIAPLGLFRYTALWLSVSFLFRIGIGRSTGLLLLAAFCFFAAKASIIGQVLTLPELLGAAIALLLAPFLLGRFSSVGVPVIAALLLLQVVLTRVLPWQFAAAPRDFQWIPFYGFLHGSQAINAISFAEKFYLYGALLLLSLRVGFSLWLAVALECILLFATSCLQTFLVGRSAEIADTLLALILGLVYALLRHQHRAEAATTSADLGQAADVSVRPVAR